uniref:KIB1-4 beta-propeller domain-containing protein n=1 Tax=Brassica oleracea var. oleracea TaxID=109376 RepID=A0A0D3A5L1_BRAOL
MTSSLKRCSGSPGLMLFPKDGSCVLYNPKEGTFQRKLGDFSGCRFLANSGNWLLLLDSGSNLYMVDAFSEKKIRLPSLESIDSADCIVKCVGDREFIRQDSDSIFSDLSADVWKRVRCGVPGHSYMSFCKNGDSHYTDIPLFHHQDLHWLDGLSEMVLWGTRLCLSTSRRYVRVLDLSGPQGFFKDITDGTPFPMLSANMSCDSSIAVTTSGQVMLVESDPCKRTCFRLYKKNPDIENPDLFGHTVTEVYSLDGEALLLDLGFTVPANKALGIEPDSIYFTRPIVPANAHLPTLTSVCTTLQARPSIAFPILTR